MINNTKVLGSLGGLLFLLGGCAYPVYVQRPVAYVPPGPVLLAPAPVVVAPAPYYGYAPSPYSYGYGPGWGYRSRYYWRH